MSHTMRWMYSNRREIVIHYTILLQASKGSMPKPTAQEESVPTEVKSLARTKMPQLLKR